MDLVEKFDTLVAASLNDNIYSQDKSFSPSGMPHFLPNVFATANWLRNISTEFGIVGSKNRDRSAGLVKFLTYSLSQGALAALNPGDLEVGGQLNRIFNPLSFAVSAVPFAREIGFASPNLAVAANLAIGNYKSRVSTEALIDPSVSTERLLLMRKGAYLRTPGLSDVTKMHFPSIGYRGELAQSSIEQSNFAGPKINPLAPSVSTQVDGGLLDKAIKGSMYTNNYSKESPYNTNNAVMPLDKFEKDYNDALTPGVLNNGQQLKMNQLFAPKKFPGGPDSIPQGARSWVFKNVSPSKKGTFAKPVAVMPDMIVHPDENKKTGLVENETQNDTNENQIYVPFMFQDLRDNPPKFLYFNAFLKPDISETFTPDWNVERFYGRVDQVPTYMGTIRTVVLSFDVIAFKPQDTPMMWVKLHKLKSLVYPEFDTFGFLNKGPMIRMRVGDLFCGAKKRGIPGYITSLDFSYDPVWNIVDGYKLPRKVTVSLAFNVVHDGNPGVYQYGSATIAPDGTFTADKNKTFGAGQFVTNDDNTTDVTVSESEMRGVMKTARDELEKLK